MIYQDYIDLGFERIDAADGVEFRETGYYGFYLQKNLNNRISITVSSGDLQKPKLYIKKSIDDTYHIITINGEVVRDLLMKENKAIFA